MKNLRINLSTFICLFLTAAILLSACKTKKILAQKPSAAVQIVSVQEETKPVPIAETDTDGDGIPDSRDKCPDKAGATTNNGCPESIPSEPAPNYKNVLFDFDSSVLQTTSYIILDEISREMKKHPEINFYLNGHASSEGTQEHNMVLSIARATAVKTYLVNTGINSTNLVVKGYGASKPLTSNDSEAGRQLNRRVEVEKF